jgi:hypothetical protein
VEYSDNAEFTHRRAQKQRDGTSNKAALKRGTDFLVFVKMGSDRKENGRGTNWVNHNKTEDKGSDKIFDYSLYLRMGCAGLGAG